MLINCPECNETKAATEFSDTLCADCFEQSGVAFSNYPKMIDRHHVCDSSCDPIKVHTDRLDSLTSFAARKRYMDANFIAIGTGTGRKVYDIGQGKVLKLALNRKGVAQNSVESDKAMHDWHSALLPKIYDADKDDKWLICAFAATAKVRDFTRLLGINMDTLFYYIEYKIDTHPTTKLLGESGIGACDLSSRVQELIDLIINFDLMYRDITRKNAWGIIGDRLVLRDFGLSLAVWDEHYKPIKKDGRFVYGEINLRK